MRDELQKKEDEECLVINTDHSQNEGTHWTCLFIKNGTSYYFDPYGFPPTLEVMNNCDVSSFRIQTMNEVICGHYCLYVLHRMSNGDNFYDICCELYHE